jgi:isopentenyl-diphosphate delta-isomerase
MRRLAEEIGIRGVQLTDAGIYTYLAADPVTGWIEHEYDHVLVGRASPDVPMTLDPDEVVATRWVSATLLRDIAMEDGYAPWLFGVLQIALTHFVQFDI